MEHTDEIHVSDLAQLEFQPGPQRLNVRLDDTLVPLIVHVRPESDKLVIFANGAVDLKSDPSKDPAEIFQRRTWAEEIDANCIFFSDVTVRRDPNVNLGWGQGSVKGFYLVAVSSVVKALSRVLGIEDPSRRLYFGSSGGGFQSIVLSAFDMNSQALVNNPQTDWSRYVLASAVNNVVENIYPGYSMEEIKSEFPERVNVLRLFEAIGRVPKITYYVNAASSSDMNRDLSNLLKLTSKNGALLDDGTITVNYYWNPTLGHSPLPKPQTVSNINNAIASMN